MEMEPKVKRQKQRTTSHRQFRPSMQAGGMHTANAVQQSSLLAGPPIMMRGAPGVSYPLVHWADAATGAPLVQWANAASGAPVIQRAHAASATTFRHRPDVAMAAGPPLIRRHTSVKPRMCQTVIDGSAPASRAPLTSNCGPLSHQSASATGIPLIQCTAAGSPVMQPAMAVPSQRDASAGPTSRSSLHVTFSTYGSSVQIATVSSNDSALSAAAVASDGSLVRATSLVSDGSSLHTTSVISDGLSLHATAVTSNKSSLRATAISSDQSSMHATSVICDGSTLRATAIRTAGSSVCAARMSTDLSPAHTAIKPSTCSLGANSDSMSPQVEPAEASLDSAPVDPEPATCDDADSSCEQ